MDAEAGIQLGVDALGFNFYAKSKRGLRIPVDFEWIGELPRGPQFVAVLVNPTEEEVSQIQQSGVFDKIQFHGEESPEFCGASPLPWIKAVPCPVPKSFPHELSRFATREWLLDAVAPAGEYGGTGQIADWSRAAEFVLSRRGEEIWLAGGLSASNVAKAIGAVRPFGVDVAGGIENSPGIKCPQKMRKFVDAVRTCSASLQ